MKLGGTLSINKRHTEYAELIDYWHGKFLHAVSEDSITVSSYHGLSDTIFQMRFPICDNTDNFRRDFLTWLME